MKRGKEKFEIKNFRKIRKNFKKPFASKSRLKKFRKKIQEKYFEEKKQKKLMRKTLKRISLEIIGKILKKNFYIQITSKI